MDTPKNCNECIHHNNCNSYYGGLGCMFRKSIKPVSAIILALCLVTVPTINVLSEDGGAIETEVAVINAEEIGIVVEEETDILEEVEEEPELEVEKIPEEKNEEIEEEDEDVIEEEVIDIPEGMKEGYISNTFYNPAEHTECEFVHCVSYDSDSDSYMFEEWCTICGEGTQKPISDEEFEALGVESNVEF